MGAPLTTVAELRAIEQAALQELPRGTLMTRAGRAAARRIDLDAGNRRLKVAVIAGPGNNGGDGFVVASELAQRGHEVICALVGAEQPNARDAADAFHHWRESGGAVLAAPPSQEFDVVVDALLGIGAARALNNAFLGAAQWINTQRGRVVALDVPSGLDADRGSWIGGIAGVEADQTITFIADKPGLHTGDGVDAAGNVIVESLELSAPPSALSLTVPADFASITQPRRRNTHKGTFGDLLVLGGAAGMVGAPLLAARAALRLGAGRVYVDCIGSPELTFDPMQPELMFRRHREFDQVQAAVIGCGLGTSDEAREALTWAMALDAAVVIDADGLNLLAEMALPPRTRTTVLTPHPLEAARLLQSTAAQVQSDRIAATLKLARRFGAIVVLKGAGSVIADADGRTMINPTGSPALATAGSGDVLAGMIGSLLAQGYQAWQATLAAVWLHGKTVEDRDRGTVASDIAQRAVTLLRGLQQSN